MPNKVESDWVIRSLDLMISSVALFMLMPLIGFLMLAIRIESSGSALFTQERLGKDKKNFTIIKLRTMFDDAERETGPIWASKDDKRITRVGGFLRKTRLDETPQFINILRGDMSLVGPRPIREKFSTQLMQLDDDYALRFLVKPGLTGYAQLYAPYGTTTQEQLEKVPYDLRYLSPNYNWKEYLLILVKTALVVIRGRGI